MKSISSKATPRHNREGVRRSRKYKPEGERAEEKEEKGRLNKVNSGPGQAEKRTESMEREGRGETTKVREKTIQER